MIDIIHSIRVISIILMADYLVYQHTNEQILRAMLRAGIGYFGRLECNLCQKWSSIKRTSDTNSIIWGKCQSCCDLFDQLLIIVNNIVSLNLVVLVNSSHHFTISIPKIYRRHYPNSTRIKMLWLKNKQSFRCTTFQKKIVTPMELTAILDQDMIDALVEVETHSDKSRNILNKITTMISNIESNSELNLNDNYWSKFSIPKKVRTRYSNFTTIKIQFKLKNNMFRFITERSHYLSHGELSEYLNSETLKPILLEKSVALSSISKTFWLIQEGLTEFPNELVYCIIKLLIKLLIK